MSADDLSEFYVHTVQVETFLGTNGYGADTFSPATSIQGFLDGASKLIRGADGEQVVAQSTFYTYPSNAAAFAPNSRVTANGLPSRVILTNVNDSGDLDLPDHVAVSLT